MVKIQEHEKIFDLSPKQYEFFKAKEKFPAYGGGWGNGKTLAGILKTYKFCEDDPNGLFVVGRKNFVDLRDSTLRDFLELYGEDGEFGQYVKGQMKYKLPNGCEILFRHLDNLGSLTNLNLSGFWMDQAEEIPEMAFTFLIGRLRRMTCKYRQGFATFNMEGHNWIWHRWKAKKVKDPHQYNLIEASTYENRRHLPDDYIESLESLPDDVYNRYVKGSWEVFEGQIYGEFDENVHVIQPFTLPEDAQLFDGLDPGVRHPFAYLIAYEDKENNLYFVDEWRESGKLIDEVAEAIREKRDGREMQSTVIDPSSAKIEQTSGENVKLQLEEQGIHSMKANNDVTAGIGRVKLRLKNKTVYIFNTCRKLIEELTQYQWLKPRLINGVLHYKEAPLKVKDDLVDVMRYIIMGRPEYYDYPEKKKEMPEFSFARFEEEEREKQMEEEIGFLT